MSQMQHSNRINERKSTPIANSDPVSTGTRSARWPVRNLFLCLSILYLLALLTLTERHLNQNWNNQNQVANVQNQIQWRLGQGSVKCQEE